MLDRLYSSDCLTPGTSQGDTQQCLSESLLHYSTHTHTQRHIYTYTHSRDQLNLWNTKLKTAHMPICWYKQWKKNSEKGNHWLILLTQWFLSVFTSQYKENTEGNKDNSGPFIWFWCEEYNSVKEWNQSEQILWLYWSCLYWLIFLYVLGSQLYLKLRDCI